MKQTKGELFIEKVESRCGMGESSSYYTLQLKGYSMEDCNFIRSIFLQSKGAVCIKIPKPKKLNLRR